MERYGSFADGSTNGGSGEFAELDAPRKIVMTRKFRSIRRSVRGKQPSRTVSTLLRRARA